VNDKFIKRKSPAKVNLVLKVLGKRPDGFHEIASLIQRISLCDEMFFAVEGKGIRLSCPGGNIPENEGNIVWRAVKLFMEKTGKPEGVTIGIKKKIPVAAGLGGGSSNAATALVTLNELTGNELGREDLVEMGAFIGSDVPFFIYGGSAWAFGRGERLENVQGIPKLWFVICNPGVALSTADVYGGLRIGLTNRPVQYTIPRLETLSQVVDKLENDLEAVSERLCRPIAELKKRLMQVGSLGTLMSGSGPTVFGIFEGREEARRAADLLSRERCVPFVAYACSI